MILHPDEARKKWCPEVRAEFAPAVYNRFPDGGFDKSLCCLADDCMYWEWYRKPGDEYREGVGEDGYVVKNIKATRKTCLGYCGNVGK